MNIKKQTIEHLQKINEDLNHVIYTQKKFIEQILKLKEDKK